MRAEITMTCNTVRTRLVAWQDEELSPGEHVVVGEHLARCPDCRALERDLARVTPEPFAKVPHALEQQLWARLDAALDDAWQKPAPPAPPRRATWRDWLTHPFELPMGVALAWGAAFGLALFWGTTNWFAARELEATLARHEAPSDGVAGADTTTVPAEQYRPASWAPPATPP